MNDLTFNILKIVLAVSAAIITSYLVPFIKNSIESSKRNTLNDIVKTAVEAMEQVIKESGKGAVKKQQVIAFVSAWANEHKINITEDQLDKLIEAVVFEMNKERK